MDYEDISYEAFEKKCNYSYQRRTMDGKTVSSNKCIAYCRCEEHPGFLTAALCRQHSCNEKNCGYYIPKGKRSRSRKSAKKFDNSQSIVDAANKKLERLEGIEVIKATNDGYNKWTLYYVTITNAYNLTPYVKSISEEINCEVEFSRLNYSYDMCVKLISKL